MRSALALAALAVAPAVAPLSTSPTITVDDPRSLSTVITPAVLPRFGGLQIFWRINIGLPPRSTVKRIRMSGYAPVILQMADNHCFQIGMGSNGSKLTSSEIIPIPCPPERDINSPRPAPKPHPTMRYIGRSWDLDAWTDKATGETLLFQGGHEDRGPVLKTSMRVLAIGALALPDAPVTELTLAGYVGRQLTLATVVLNLPEPSA
jgi:hypothetical protein